MLQLQPQNNFTVVRQLSDPSDTGTYFVRAVIRNAYTDEIIANLDLDGKGGQRFKKDWRVPADPSGQGFYISIITYVYSDAGYTTQDTMYGNEGNTYLIADRINNNKGGLAGGIDARTLKRIIKEELDSRDKKEEIKLGAEKKPEDNRLDLVLESLRSLKIPEVDLSPFSEGINELRKQISAKEVTPETDISPILAKMSEQDSEIKKLQKFYTDLEQSVTDIVISALKDRNEKLVLMLEKRKIDEDEEEEEIETPLSIINLAK